MNTDVVWSAAKVQELLKKQFPNLSLSQDLEEQLSSLETMELLLVLEKAIGAPLEAIELEPLLHGNYKLFCEIVNGKRN